VTGPVTDRAESIEKWRGRRDMVLIGLEIKVKPGGVNDVQYCTKKGTSWRSGEFCRKPKRYFSRTDDSPRT